MQNKIPVTLELEANEFSALVKFVKQLKWADMRACAVDNNECYLIEEALGQFNRSASDKGAEGQPVHLIFELDPDATMALAQFVKRLTWSEMRAYAVDDDDCYFIKYAINKLQRSLADVGYAPR